MREKSDPVLDLPSLLTRWVRAGTAEDIMGSAVEKESIGQGQELGNLYLRVESRGFGGSTLQALGQSAAALLGDLVCGVSPWYRRTALCSFRRAGAV